MCKGLNNDGMYFKTKDNYIVAANDGRCMTGLSTKYVTLKPCNEANSPPSAAPVEWIDDDWLMRKGLGKLGISNARFLYYGSINILEGKFRRVNPAQGETFK